MAKLSEKQKRFCEEYMIDLCGTQAAIRAGYSPISANQQASELLAKPNISAYVDKLRAEQSKRTGVTADRVIRELAKIAFINPNNLININTGRVKEDATEDDLSCIASVKVKTIPTEEGDIVEREVKLADKTKSLELLGKHLGIADAKIDIDIPVNIVIKKEYE